MGVSIREYARQRGVSDTAVRKAIKQGRITKEPDGSIDIKRADKQWRENTANPKTHTMKPVPTSALQDVATTLRENGRTVSAHGSTYLEAKTANEIIKAQTNRLRLKQLKGELIDRKLACDHVFQLGRQERDAWLTWPARVASQMAAETVNLNEACQLQIVLERYVHDHLSALSEIEPDFD